MPAFAIAKYAVTNAQFAKFVEAGGYKQKQWWTAAGWQEPENNKWAEPRYWRDSKWNGANHPVVGVLWDEAYAYSKWLSDITGEAINLPTEQQWQRAAQGDDGRIFPWGNEWDCNRCNCSVKPCKSSRTTPVTQYEGKGDSLFGVVDMAGNVSEWCLTNYYSGEHDSDGAHVRVLRGGAWKDSDTAAYLRTTLRQRRNPNS